MPHAKTPMCVLYLDHCAQLSGAEIALHRLLAHLPTDVAPSVVLAESGPLVAALESLGVPVIVVQVSEKGDVRKDEVRWHSLGPSAVFVWALYISRLFRHVKYTKPDVIHTNSLKAALYGGVVGRLAGVPVIWHVRDSLTADYLPATALRLVKTAGQLLPRRVIANSGPTRDTFTELVGTRASRRLQPTVISNVLPDTSFGNAKDQYGPVRTIAMVGRIAPWKGQDVFLRAFAAARSKTPSLRAVIAGTAMFGEERYASALTALAQDLGIDEYVTFLGFVDDIPGLLSGVDLLVHASVTAEPFGQVIVEGMAAGLPVIATDIGGPREIIESGVDGLLTPPGDDAKLAVAIETLVADTELAEQLGRAAATSALRYGPGRSLPALIALYRSLCPPSAAPTSSERKIEQT